jgi:DNA-binding winged helix-turn-helix (wHTH) protein/Tol biopolymer transport system component
MKPEFKVGSSVVAPSLNEIRRNGSSIHLEPKVMQVLVYLAQHSGEVVSKEELIHAIWPDTFVTDDVLKRCVSQLRKAFDDDSRDPQAIETIAKGGYRLLLSVVEVDRIAAPQPVAHAPIGSKKWHYLFAFGLVSVAIAVLLFLVRNRREPVPTRIVSFEQLTKDGRIKLGPLLTDGSRIYYRELLRDGYLLMQVSVKGGEGVPIQSSLIRPLPVDISPDGTEILLTDGPFSNPGQAPHVRELWIQPVTGGSPRRVGTVMAHDAAWQPDGNRIVYAHRHDLYVVEKDGSRPRKLITLPGFPETLRWSRDGKLLRFSMWRPIAPAEHSWTRSSSLWEVAADGSGLRSLLPNWSNQSLQLSGEWVAGDRSFIFQTSINNLSEDRSDLWAFDGKAEPVRLTAGPMNFSTPVPDKLQDEIFAIGMLPRGELVRYDRAAGQFVPYLSGISADNVNFSIDGQWVTYALYPEGTLWRSKTDGSQRLQLTFPPQRASLPRWSPDGKSIVFVSMVPGEPWNIHLIAASGGASQRLVPSEANQADPTWSPDGTAIVFGSAPGVGSIHTLDLKTKSVSTVPGSDGYWSPRWSPDGRYIAALDAHVHLSLFDSHTKMWKRLTNFFSAWPSWSRDGQYIYFCDWRTNLPLVVRVRIKDGTIETIVDTRRVGPTPAGTYGWIGLAPDESVLMTREIGATEIYALKWQGN